jgi:hypothetical protein
MAQYRKKPVVIEAIQWDGNNFDDIKDFADSKVRCPTYDEYCINVYGEDKTTLLIYTLEGTMIASKGDFIIKGIASKGDFIIKGVKGEFYPCKPDIFEATYEIV